MDKLLILDQTYSGEGLNDIEEDITYAIEAGNFPKDKYGFVKGAVNIVLTYIEDQNG